MAEREEKVGKKKKRKGPLLLAGLAVLLAVSVGGGIWLASRKLKQEEQQAARQIVAGEQEELRYMQVLSVIGNELEVSLTEEDGGETETLQVPVGTPVITRLGNTATFSALSAGNQLAVLYESGTDNILKIWITVPAGQEPGGAEPAGDGVETRGTAGQEPGGTEPAGGGAENRGTAGQEPGGTEPAGDGAENRGTAEQEPGGAEPAGEAAGVGESGSPPSAQEEEAQ